jgi:hypothetical protein
MTVDSTAKALRKALVPHAVVAAPFQWGVVAAFTSTPPLTCDVHLNGTQNTIQGNKLLGTDAALTRGIRYLASYSPAVGDLVFIAHTTGGLRSDRVILGPLAGKPTLAPGGITEITSTGGTVLVSNPFGPVVDVEVGGVSQVIAGQNIVVSPASGTGVVSISGGAGGLAVDAAFSVPGTITTTVPVFGQYPVSKATASTTSTVIVTAGTADSGSDDMTVTFYRNGSSCGTLVLTHATTYATGTLTLAGFASVGDLLQVAITTYAGSTAANIGMFWRAS